MNAARSINRDTVQRRLATARDLLDHLGEVQGVTAEQLRDD